MTNHDNFITVNFTTYYKDIYYDKQIDIENNKRIIEKIKEDDIDLEKIDTWFIFERPTNKLSNLLVTDYREICKFKIDKHTEVKHSDSCKKDFNIVPPNKFINLCDNLYKANLW